MKRIILLLTLACVVLNAKSQTLQTVTTAPGANITTNAIRLTGEANITATTNPELVLGVLSTQRSNDPRVFIGWKNDNVTNPTTNGLAGTLLLQGRTNFADVPIDFATGFTTASLRMRIAGNGNVSIGDNSLTPVARLLIKGSGTTNSTTSLLIQNSAGTELLRVLDNGNVGIGISAPSSRLDISGLGGVNIDFRTTGRMAIRGSSPGISITDGTTERSFIGWAGAGINSQALGVYTPTADPRGGWSTFNILNDGSVALGSQTTNVNAKLDVTGNIFANGKVLIGMSGLSQADYTNKISTYSLAVNGDAIFNRVRVKLFASWPDYVFNESYHLLPIDELERFIKKEKHLPNVTPASEAEAEGIDVASTQRQLLQKVEELTLYIIELKKRIDTLEKNNQIK